MFPTQSSPTSASGQYNALMFMFQQALAKISTACPVEVVKVTNAGDLSPVGFVDVRPLVNQMDGARNAVPHGVIHSIPYFRLQGGASAIVLDPRVGDIGVAVFCERDISAVKASKKRANPGSLRKHDKADGWYFGGGLNAAPTQVVQFTESGLNIISQTAVNITAPTISLNGAVVLNGPVSSGTSAGAGPMNITGPITVTNDVTAGGKSVMGHTHSDPQGGTTSGPN